MNYPQYRDDLQRIHESEVYGLAVFGTAARFTRNPERKGKWLALKALEEKTLDRYLTHMRASSQPVREPRIWRLRGQVEGAVLGLLPWRLAMKLVADATVPFQETFLRLKKHAEGTEQNFFSYVYAHEKAIEAFANKELAKDESSLKAVEALLAK
ncbi:MAG: hypothetical protein KDA21_08395 [Phycisphaerales bacterium]|nr:hypothetical protein [Phycisphaerales bacterium]